MKTTYTIFCNHWILYLNQLENLKDNAGTHTAAAWSFTYWIFREHDRLNIGSTFGFNEFTLRHEVHSIPQEDIEHLAQSRILEIWEFCYKSDSVIIKISRQRGTKLQLWSYDALFIYQIILKSFYIQWVFHFQRHTVVYYGNEYHIFH